MNSMYVTIMDLPLFKGISEAHVSAFLEKTHVDFVNYAKGDILYRRHDECRDMRYVITGSVCRSHCHISETCTINEVLHPGSVLGADRLFGMDTRYPSQAEALTDVSVMTFSKEQYLRLLASDEIYLINVLNFLSRRVQRSIDSLRFVYSGTLIGNLAYWLATLTEVDSDSIEIQTTIPSLAALTNISQASVRSQISELQQAGLANYTPGRIRILSRSEIIDAAMELNVNSLK